MQYNMMHNILTQEPVEVKSNPMGGYSGYLLGQEEQNANAVMVGQNPLSGAEPTLEGQSNPLAQTVDDIHDPDHLNNNDSPHLPTYDFNYNAMKKDPITYMTPQMKQYALQNGKGNSQTPLMQVNHIQN